MAASAEGDARQRRSRAALRDALLALLERKPLDQITVRDICAGAGVHYATFFRHHASKEALLEAVAAEQMQRLVGLSMEARAAADTHSAVLALCRYVDEYRRLWATLLNGGAGGAMRAELLRRSRDIAAVEPPVNGWLPSGLGTICAASLIAETLAWWLREPDGAWSAEAVADILHRLLGAAILAPD